MLETIARYIADNQLLHPDHRYLVALSGGADSVSLLMVLHELGYSVEAAHCNFRLRGDEADRDERFCSRLCESLGVALHKAHFDTREWAALHKLSIETAARQLRYVHFAQWCRDLELQGVCVAHHKDDLAETVVMHLARGTGLRGLCGIRPRQQLHFGPLELQVIRPMLCVSRHEIEAFLSARGQQFVTDHTNFEPNATRNKVRLGVMPQLREVNAAATDNIVATARHVAYAADFVDQTVARAIHRLVPHPDRLPVSFAPEAVEHEFVLFRLLEGYGFTPAQTEHIYHHLHARQSARYLSPTHMLLFDRGSIIIDRIDNLPMEPHRLPEEGTYVLAPHLRITARCTVRTPDFQPSNQPFCATLDADRVAFPLTVRPVAPGDRFSPYGMEGSKTVGRYLTDRKLTAIERRRQLVVSDADGNIIWLPGLRTSQTCCITDATTCILTLTMTHEHAAR